MNSKRSFLMSMYHQWPHFGNHILKCLRYFYNFKSLLNLGIGNFILTAVKNSFYGFMLTITKTILVTSRTIGRHNRCYQSHTQRCMKDLLTEISHSTELLEPLTTYYQIKQQSRQSINTKRAQVNKAILYFSSFNKEKNISFFKQFRNSKLQYTIIRTVKNPSAS